MMENSSVAQYEVLLLFENQKQAPTQMSDSV